MTSEAWLRNLENAVRTMIPHAEVVRADDRTMSFAAGLRVVVVHIVDDVALLACSFSVGASVASRLHNRVEHLEPVSYRLDEKTATAAADAVAAHLR